MHHGNSRPHPKTPSDLIKDGKFSSARSKVNDTSTLDSIALAFGENVIKEVLDIVALHRPELIHVFTHGNGNPKQESLNGTFANRGGYYSALNAPYYEIVVPVPVVRGFTAIKVETVVTKELKAQFPFIKKVDLLNDDCETVISNSKLGVSTMNLADYVILLLTNSSAADAVQNRVVELVISFFSMSKTS